MPTYTPEDTLIGPIVHEISTIIQTQIPSIAHIYEKLPDRQPLDNSVLIPLRKFTNLQESNGRQKVRLTFGVRHVFRKGKIEESLSAAYSYLMPWLLVLASWSTQNLNGKAITTTATDGGISQVLESGQLMIALVINVDVITEYLIPLS